MDSNEICNNFGKNFKQNVKNIIHECEIKTINHSHIELMNSFYLRKTYNEETFNLINKLNIKKVRAIME